MIKPYYQEKGITIYHGDCREILPTLAYSANTSVFLDCPYNAGKAAWDNEFPYWMFDLAACLAPVLALTPGIDNLLRCPRSVAGLDYRWTLAAHLTNGMTRGRLSFANWIPCLLYGRGDALKYEPRQDCKDFPVGLEKKADHPCPKLLNVMRWFLSFLPGDTVADFFMGSGTTLVAAKELGRNAIGVDREERYCEEAANRLRQGVFNFATAGD